MCVERHLGIKSRPFDFYVAFLVFFSGFWAVIDPMWPEEYKENQMLYWILLIEDVYMMVAGLTVMLSLIALQTMIYKKRPRLMVSALVGDMFGWLFTATAATMITLSTPWFPPSAVAGDAGTMLWVWAGVWGGLAIGAWWRWWDLHKLGRGSSV